MGHAASRLGWATIVLFALANVEAAGQTTSRRAGRGAAWENAFLSVSWHPGSTVVSLLNKRTGDTVAIPIGIDTIEFDVGRITGFCTNPSPPSVTDTGRIWRFVHPEVGLAKTSVRFRCEVVFEFNRSAARIRKKGFVVITAGGRESLLLKQVVIDNLRLEGQDPRQPFAGWQSYPVLGKSFFCGVVFPVANAAVSGDQARLSYRPGVRLACDAVYATWPVVYGVSEAGRSRAAFESYIRSLRPASPGLHIQYNSWWSARLPLTEQQMLDFVRTFRTELYEPYGQRLDSFCLDCGWSHRRSIWKIDERHFPQGFSNLTRALQGMGSQLALWVSPSSCYPQAQDNHWAEKSGYETCNYIRGHRRACLAGAKYQRAFKESLVDLTRRYKIRHFKFDGYIPTCPQKDHGHEPRELSAQKTALGLIDIFKAVREANPDVWMEATCFGFRPSPWWLAYVNTVIGTFGDDAPPGRVPCPVYRESYTTARDFFNLQGARDVLVPICAQEVLGIVHQTPEPFQNDAVVTVLRGHSFLPLYVNPKHMDARRWRFLARLCSWARANAALLAETTAVRFGGWADDKTSRAWERPLPRDPYGYAHFEKDRGLVLLRNPWIKPRRVELVLDESMGVGTGLKDVVPVCLYPRFGRLGGQVSHGGRLAVKLAPYETALVAFGGYPGAPAIGDATCDVSVSNVGSKVQETERKVRLRFNVSGGVAARQLWLLYESDAPMLEPVCRVTANGSSVTLRAEDSQSGWRASGHRSPEYWVWLVGELPAGASTVEADLEALHGTRLSGWLVAAKRVPDDAGDDRPIPPPEVRYLDAVAVLPPVAIELPEADRLGNVALAEHGATATASSKWPGDYDAGQTIDGKPGTRWNSAPGDTAGAWLAVDLGTPRKVEEVRFREAAGGRITAYKIQFWNGSDWQDVLTASKINRKASVRHRFEPVVVRKLRLWVVSAIEVPTLYAFEVYGKR